MVFAQPATVTFYDNKNRDDISPLFVFLSAATAVKDKEKKNDNYDPKESIIIKNVA